MNRKQDVIGNKLPEIKTQIPGPNSIKFGKISIMYEPSSITRISPDNIPVFWKKAVDENVVDVDGNIYIDCTSAFGVSFIGHTNSTITKAVAKQSECLLHSMSNIFPNNVRGVLSKRLVELVTKNNGYHVLYANSGSECIEIAIKAAFLFTQKPGVIAFKGSFHGQTLGALNVTGQLGIRNPFIEYLSPHARFFPFPYPYREGDSKEFPNTETCLEYVECEIKKSKDTSSPIGAIILEPIQGCNGYIIPPDAFIRRLYNICKEHDILMIADEIFTGLGRTGKWLAMNHVGITPDIICIGKILGGGIPIAACLASKEIFNAFQSPSFLSLHESTFAGNPLACASALTTINTIESENLLEQSLKKGKIILDMLKKLKGKYTLVGDVRGRGLLIAVELVKNKDTKEPAVEETTKLVNAALQKGIILLLTRVPVGNVIGFAPPLTITKDQIDYVLETINQCMCEIVEKNGGKICL